MLRMCITWAELDSGWLSAGNLRSRCPPGLARLRTKAAANSSAGPTHSERSGSTRSGQAAARAACRLPGGPSFEVPPMRCSGLSRFSEEKARPNFVALARLGKGRRVL
jgi:hypothetical protein